VAKRATRWILAVLCLSPGAPAIGQQQKPHDLASQSLEELMNVEVTSVSKKEQKLSRTAAAVFVVSQEDIQRSGATNIPDLLRMVPGMEVAQMNGNTWAVSARGLNGQFSNELLVLVDGRNAYTPTFGGVFWDTLAMSLDNIERIEVIRGPGGSIWGENAVNGVVNIIQKKAEETKGGKVTASEGNDDQVSGTVQYGGTLGKNTDYRVYSKYFNQAPLPSARAVYEFNGRRMVWAGVSHAVRIPAETGVDLRLNVVGVSGPDGTPAVISVLGNPHSKDEGVIAYEAGYRAEVGQRVSVDLAAYYNTYNNSTEPAAPFFEATPPPAHLVLPSISQNLIDGETHGAEIVTKWKVSKRCTLIPSYDLERIHMHSRPPSEDTTTAPDTNGSDPHQHARVGSQVGLPHRVTWDTAARFTGRLPAQGRALVHQAGYQCAVAVDRASNAQRRWPKFVASAAPGIYR
jgi:outer membrane receptor for ferrienterochelin and colicin